MRAFRVPPQRGVMLRCDRDLARVPEELDVVDDRGAVVAERISFPVPALKTATFAVRVSDGYLGAGRVEGHGIGASCLAKPPSDMVNRVFPVLTFHIRAMPEASALAT